MWTKFIRSFLILMVIASVVMPSSKAVGAEPMDIDVKTIINDMTLEEKVGQLFIVHVYGQTPTDPVYEQINMNNNRGGKNFKEVIENYHIGGIIYFNWTDNIGTPLDATQVNALSNGIQEISVENGGIPLFVSTDQEGGTVARVTHPATELPGNMAVGATRAIEYAHQSAEILGKELHALGINMNFAPTLDVNVNPANPVIGIRSFSEDPELVTDLGVAQIQGYQDQQVMATAKHFPGHGDTDVDSHYGLPIIEKDLETLFEEDIAPFKEAISAGVDAIMPAHIVVPALDDSGLPATLSKPILTDLLRDELGFTGLIVTDSLGMSGANVVPPERVPVEAIKAGVDLLLNPPNVELAYESVLEAVNSGEISESRLDESVSRIVQQKQDQGLFDDPYQHPDGLDVIGNDDHLSQATTIADKSITLVKNDNVLPLQMKDDVLVVGPNIANANMLEEHLNVRGFNTSIAHTADAPTEEDINAAADEAAAHDVVVIVTHSAHLSEQQQQLVTALHSVGKPVIVTAARNPYDVAEFPGVDAYIAAYGNRAISHEAVAKILTGEVNPQGLLPVTIPDHYEFGHGLSYHIDATYMKTFVSQLEKSGRLTDRTVIRTMNVHLSAVDHFEQQERSDKVVQHMNSFLQMIDMFTRSGQINEDVAQVLEAHASEVIESWEEG